MPNSHLIGFLIPFTSRDGGDAILVVDWEESVLDSDLMDDLRLASRNGPGWSGLTPIEKVANCSAACSTAASVRCSSLGGEALGSSCESAGLMVPNMTLWDGLGCEPFKDCAECSEAPDPVVTAGEMEPNSILCETA